MQLTHQQLKVLLSPLYCEASMNDAVDMRELTGLMEGIREATAGKNGYQCWAQLSIDRLKYDTDAYRPYLISLKKSFEQKLYDACVSEIEARIKAKDPNYFQYWLNEYAASLVNWFGNVYDPLCRKEFDFLDEEKALQQHYALFNQYLMDGKWVETYPYFTQLAADERLDINTRSTLEATAGLVQLYWMTDIEASIPHFNRAKELDRENYIAHRCVGEYHLKKLDFETARSYFLNAVSAQPNDPANYLLVGDTYKEEGKYGIAEKWYVDAYDKNFLTTNVYAKLIDLYSFEEYKAKCSVKLGELIQKSQQIIQNTEYDNEQYENLRNIGNMFLKQKKRDEARIYYEKAIALHPELTGAILDKAYSLGDENDFELAEASFKQTMREGPYASAYNADAYWGLGWLCEKQEKYREAIEYYEKCITERPAWKERICNLIGNVYFKLNEFRSAAGCYENAIDLNPTEQVYWDNLKDAIDKLGDAEMELKYLTKAIQRNPQSAEHYNKLGIHYYKQKALPKAISSYSKAIELAQDKAVYYENRGLALEESGDVQSAIVDYKKAYDLEPDAQLANKLGVLMFNDKFYEEAIRYYDTAIEADENNALYFGNRALAFEYNNQFVEAIENYKKAIAISTGNGQYQNRLGAIYYKQENYSEAKTYFEQAVQLDSENAVYLENLAMVHYKQEAWEEAATLFERIAQKTDDEYIVCRLAEVNIRLSRLEAALENVNKALAFSPGVLEYLASKAMILERLKQYEGAVEVYEEIITKQPDNDTYINRLGIMHYNLGLQGYTQHLDQAIEYYSQAIALKPAAVYYQNLGMAYEALYEYNKAEEAFLKSLELEPENHDYLNYTGVFYFNRLLNTNKAIAFYKKAIALHDTEAVYYQNLGLAYRELQSYAEAEKAYVKSLELDPFKAEHQYGTGTFYVHIGEYEKALEHFKAAVALDPDNEIYQSAIEQLPVNITAQPTGAVINTGKDSGTQSLTSSAS